MVSLWVPALLSLLPDPFYRGYNFAIFGQDKFRQSRFHQCVCTESKEGSPKVTFPPGMHCCALNEITHRAACRGGGAFLRPFGAWSRVEASESACLGCGWGAAAGYLLTA